MPVNNRRIAKNTIILYFRMLISMFVSLYTSRIIFNTLGVDNFGLYNVVGGIIVFFTFLSLGLTTSTRRYITTAIGKNKNGDFQHVFNISFQAHILIALIVFIIAECVGVYVVNYVLNIPAGRYYAANFVYQISIFIAILGIFQSPYESVIIAHEKMDIYAYVSIFVVVVKLMVAFLVEKIPGDKLIVFSILMLSSSIIFFFIYYFYCNHTYIYCKLKKIKDRILLKEIFKFMSWSMLGQIATVATNQGVSVLVNVYYSVVVNAAMGISNQVTGIVTQFTSNFQTAFNPQIIKLYNNNEINELSILINRAAKISSFLILIFLIPICFEIDTVLNLWLGDYPKYAPQFVVLTLAAIYIECIGAPLYMVMYSQTNIAKYQVIISSVYCMNFFIGWMVLSLGAFPYTVIIVRIAIFAILLIIRLIYLKKLIRSFNISYFLSDVLLRGVIITSVVCTIVFFVKQQIHGGVIVSMLFVCTISLITTITFMYLIGLKAQERTIIVNLIKNKIKKSKNRG